VGRFAVKALILYVLFVVAGAAVAVGIGWYVEREVSATASLLVFLTLFFLNFVVSWIFVVLAMDGSLKNIKGAQEQLDVERTGRASISKRG
jgi:hypothetical protein